MFCFLQHEFRRELKHVYIFTSPLVGTVESLVCYLYSVDLYFSIDDEGVPSVEEGVVQGLSIELEVFCCDSL